MTTLKTVSMYLRAAKTEAEDAGESTDGMVESVSELRKELLSLTGNKVDIQADDNTFKSTYQILKELSEVWHELTDVSQANILEMVGGKRNSNVVAAILENFTVANDALETSADAANSALEENAKVLESIEGKISIFKATFEEMSNNLISSDLIKLVVDFGTGLLSFVNGVIELCDAIGGLKTVLLGTIAVLLTFRTEWLLTTATMIGTAIWSVVVKGFNLIIGIVPAVISKIKNLIFAWNMYQTTAIGTAEATAAASAVMQASIPVIGLVLAAITALVGGIALYNNAQDEAAQKSAELAKAWKDEHDSLDETIAKYKKLSDSMSSGNLSATELASTKEQLASIQDDLADKYGKEAEKIDLVNGKYDEEIAKLRELIGLKATESEADLLNTKENTEDKLRDSGAYINLDAGLVQMPDEYDAIKSVVSAAGLSDYLDDSSGALEFKFSLTPSMDTSEVIRVYNDMLKLRDMLAQSYKDEISEGGALEDFYNDLNKKVNNMKTAVSEYQSALDDYNLNQAVRIFNNAMNVDGTHKADEFGLVNGSLIKTKEEFGAYITSIGASEEMSQELKEQLVNIANTAFPEFANSAYNAGDAVYNTSTKIGTATEKLKSASSGIAALASAYQELADEDTGYIKTDTLANIKEAVGELSNWNDYQDKLLSAKIGTDEFNSVLGELTYAILENQFSVSGLANATEEEIEAVLRENGVLNANTIATEAVAIAKFKLKAQTELATSTTAENISSLIADAEACGIAENAYINLIAQEIIFNQNGLDVSQKLAALQTLAQQAGITSAALKSILNSPYEQDSASQKKWATDHGFTVSTKKNKDGTTKMVKNSKGEWVEDWIWTKDGVTYENANEAALSMAGSYFSEVPTVSTPTVPNYSGATKSSSSKKDTEETFNWIEIKLSRIQRAITNLGKTVSATWKSWTDRNKALKEQMSGVRTEISAQQAAYNKYISLANSVGLGEPYASLVRNGAMDISTITDENLAEKIKLYQEYWEAALDAYDSVLDLENELANLVQTEFDNTAKRYDDELSMHEHQISMLESSADILETRGYMVGTGIYDALIQQEDARLTDLKNKYASLESVLNSSNITKYSEQWYAMQLEILGVKEEIQNTTKALAEYDNTLREIGWNLFDKLQEKISAITTEANFLIDLMSDEKMFNDDGSITKHGQATLGLHALNYNTYMAQADEYATELQQINAELANDPYNQTLLERRDELLEQQRDMILAAEDEKQAMKDLMSEGYDALLNAMDEIISKRKEMLSQIKDLYDYEKSIAEQTAEVSKYKKIINSMQGMADTEEGRAALQKYEVSLKEAQENLEETEYDKYISDQEQMLDSLYNKTEEWINSRLDGLDGVIREVIESTNTNASEIKTTLETETQKVGTTLTTEMEKIWSTNGTFTSVVSNYGSQQLTTLKDILSAIKNYIAKLENDAEEKAKAETAASTPAATPSTSTTPPAVPPATNTNSSSSSSSWGSWFISKTDTYPKSQLKTETSIVDRLKYRNIDSSLNARAKYYSAMGGSGIYTGSSQQNRWMIAQMKAHGFTDGGTIGRLIKASGEDGFVLAKTGEEILSLEKIKALGESFSMMYPVVNALSKLPALNGITSSQAGRMIQIDIGDIQMYGVNDPETFALQLKDNMLNNSSIRKIMKDTTIGEALGKNSMIRYTR